MTTKTPTPTPEALRKGISALLELSAAIRGIQDSKRDFEAFWSELTPEEQAICPKELAQSIFRTGWFDGGIWMSEFVNSLKASWVPDQPDRAEGKQDDAEGAQHPEEWT